MHTTQVKCAVLLLLGVGFAGSGARAAPPKADEMGPGPRPGRPPAALLAERFTKIHATIKPTDKESKGMDEIPWLGTLDSARRKAAVEGKPIFLFATSKHPLGES